MPKLVVSRSDRARFLSMLERSTNGCLIWTGYCLRRNGYGVTKVQGKSFYAHRLAWLLSGRSLLKAKPCVLHSCDTPTCCEPTHLFAGTQSDNMRDMASKGRGRKTLSGLPRGVYRGYGSTYRVRVYTKNRGRKNLCGFRTVEDAVRAYAVLREKLHG